MNHEVQIFVGKDASFRGDVVSFAMTINGEAVDFSSKGFKGIRCSYSAENGWFQDGAVIACKKGANLLAQFLELKHLEGEIIIQNGKMLNRWENVYDVFDCGKIDEQFNPEKLIRNSLKRNFWIRLAMRNMNFNALG